MSIAVAFLRFLYFDRDPVFFIRRPKTPKDSTLNFLMPHRKIFVLTKQRLLLLS
jgi:hypothetical protein